MGSRRRLHQAPRFFLGGWGRRAPSTAQPLWACHVVDLPLEWVSPKDMTGHYGLTRVECTPTYLGRGSSVGPYSLVRQLQRIWSIILEL